MVLILPRARRDRAWRSWSSLGDRADPPTGHATRGSGPPTGKGWSARPAARSSSCFVLFALSIVRPADRAARCAGRAPRLARAERAAHRLAHVAGGQRDPRVRRRDPLLARPERRGQPSSAGACAHADARPLPHRDLHRGRAGNRGDHHDLPQRAAGRGEPLRQRGHRGACHRARRPAGGQRTSSRGSRSPSRRRSTSTTSSSSRASGGGSRRSPPATSSSRSGTSDASSSHSATSSRTRSRTGRGRPRNSSGTVFIYTDHTLPTRELREELKRICETSEHWDGRVCVWQVTDVTERTVQHRALVSAKDSPTLWDLRVHVREQLIEYLQRAHPGALRACGRAWKSMTTTTTHTTTTARPHEPDVAAGVARGVDAQEASISPSSARCCTSSSPSGSTSGSTTGFLIPFLVVVAVVCFLYLFLDKILRPQAAVELPQLQEARPADPAHVGSSASPSWGFVLSPGPS